MAEFGTPTSSGRVKGLTIVKPVVFGNMARYFGKKREEDGHTHQWTVYIKPYKNEKTWTKDKEWLNYDDDNIIMQCNWCMQFAKVDAEKQVVSLQDLSTYVKKVNFKLHESYPNQNRVITKPPYEVTETGWGEFEVVIKIYFCDPNERPVTLYHLLKLFQSETDIMLGKKSLVAEFYDELNFDQMQNQVFNDPTVMMHQLLTNPRPIAVGPYKHETDFEERKEKTLNSILAAKKKIRYEITELNDRLKQKKETIQKLKKQISQLEESVSETGVQPDVESLT